MEKKTQEKLHEVKEALLILKKEGKGGADLFDMLLKKKEKKAM